MDDETQSRGEEETELIQPNERPAVQPVTSDFSAEFLRHEDDQGVLEYKLFVPSGYDEDRPVPLVVMLHGCTQDPDTFAAATRIADVAERETFVTALPKQSRSRHFGRCWRWFEDENTDRGRGEVAMIAGMTREIVDTYAIDETRVFVGGLSAGGAMAIDTAVAYPDLFRAVCVHSGLPYDAAESEAGAGPIMQEGQPYDPQQKAQEAFDRAGEHARVLPVIVFHGADDFQVDPTNASNTAEQAVRLADLAGEDRVDFVADRIVDGRSGQLIDRRFTRSEYHDEHERPVVVTYVVEGMGHAWSGGSFNGTFVDPFGPDATALMWDFFERHGEDPVPKVRPVADAHSVVASVGESVTFYGGGSRDPDGGELLSYEWAFGDGTTEAGRTVTHAYDTPGEYEVTLTVTDDENQTDTDTRTVRIEA